MQITVFGASGRVGRLVVATALERGYDVVAFVRSETHQKPHEHLRFVVGDIYNGTSVADAVVGSTAVISALGSWGTTKKDILTVGMQYIIPAMDANNIERIISLTGADARASGDTLGLIHRITHFFIRLGAGKILSDGEAHIRLLEQSGLAWTVVRSPIMNDSGLTAYSLQDRRPLPWTTIHRRAVSESLVDLLTDHSYDGRAPYIVHPYSTSK